MTNILLKNPSSYLENFEQYYYINYILKYFLFNFIKYQMALKMIKKIY